MLAEGTIRVQVVQILSPKELRGKVGLGVLMMLELQHEVLAMKCMAGCPG